MCPFPFRAGGRDHLSSRFIKRAPRVSVSRQTSVSGHGHAGKRQGRGVMSRLTAGSRSCVWEANNIAAILPSPHEVPSPRVKKLKKIASYRGKKGMHVLFYCFHFTSIYLTAKNLAKLCAVGHFEDVRKLNSGYWNLSEYYWHIIILTFKCVLWKVTLWKTFSTAQRSRKRIACAGRSE